MNYTDDQKNAIELSGDSLIISAAAGSGKTAVLAERVARMLSDREHQVNPCSILALTFTEAAAAQMRTRITESLRARLAANPKDGFIRSQLLMLPSARIGTIHSACFELIRQNFEALDIDPAFGIADSETDATVRAQVSDAFFEEIYALAATKPELRRLLDYFGTDKKDSSLFKVIGNVSDYLKNEPFPEEFLKKLTPPDSDNVFSIVPDEYFAEPLKAELGQAIAEAEELCREAPDEKCRELYTRERDGFEQVLQSVIDRDYDKAYALAWAMMFKSHPSNRQPFTSRRNVYKNRFITLRKEYFAQPAQTVLRDRGIELEAARGVVSLCIELDEAVRRRRAELKLLSFDDAERYALKLLVNPDGSKTELAKKLSEQYHEIIVDESQDCSRIQNCIFSALSRDEKNLFRVGDVKQSIYRFRCAYPKQFIQTLSGAGYPDGETLTRPSRIDLAHNFRSHPKVLGFVNRVFGTLMRDGRGGIDYADGHTLRHGGLYPGNAPASVTVTLLTDEGAENAGSRRDAEAEYVANKIRSIIGVLDIYDPKAEKVRKVRAGDVALLLRAPSTGGGAFEQALRRAGIGCVNSNPSSSILETQHVNELVAYLKTIDDPYRDLPLIALLRSDYFGFSAAELGRIRAAKRGAPFFDALNVYAQKDERAARFLSELETLRTDAQICSVYSLINTIFERSGALIRAAARPDGDVIRTDLEMIAQLAAEFESSRYRGLFAFIKYIDRLKKRMETKPSGKELPSAQRAGSGDCVSMMSIHKAKGLEFPVVFLADTASQPGAHDSTDLLCDAELGAAAKLRDEINHREYDPLYYKLIRKKLKREETDESMRLLYVALTRAGSHLFVSGAMKESEAAGLLTSENADPYDKRTFINWIIRGAGPLPKTFAEFAGVEAKSGALYDGVIESAERAAQEAETEAPEPTVIPAAHIRELLSRRYPHEADAGVPAKLSVSEIKNKSSHARPARVKPRFMTGDSGADRGNATHRFLQFCDFSAIADMPSLEKELDRLTANGFITAEDGRLIIRDKVLRFLQSGKMRELEKTVAHKEHRFLFDLPAREVTDADSDEPVIVQGVIDCWYETPDGAVILDYKTDSVSNAAELVSRYAVQLDMYEKALTALYGAKVKQKLIYSFCLEQFIEV